MAMVALVNGIVSIHGALLPSFLFLLFLLFLLIILLACKPWRFFSRNYPSLTIKPSSTSSDMQDEERPLVSQDLDVVQSNITDHHHPSDSASEVSLHQTEADHASPPTHEAMYKHKHKPPRPPSQLSHGDSLILEISDTSDDVVVGQTLKRPSAVTNDESYGAKQDTSHKSRSRSDNDSSIKPLISKSTADQRSILNLEVIAGPSIGARYSVQSTNRHKLPLTLGRVPPSVVMVNDSEVSGKHAVINWNLNKLKWELVDMGSLNGTLLNSMSINHPQIGSRLRGDPVELGSGDIITLGTTSKICVEITSEFNNSVPFGVGLVSDPMCVRRGGKKLPMEDVCYYHWPLPGVDKFGVFGICDGHGGAAAALSASKIMPEMITRILSDTYRREKVFSHHDASDVLREAFSQTEAQMDYLYEGCTATVLLVWADDHNNYFAQCANVGDSACIANIKGQQIKMTEDHRVVSYNERLRMQAAGEPLKDGETRLCGLNLGRMLGDKYLKEQDTRFSSEPYISQAVYMNSESRDFAIMASDGFWDVVNSRKAIQLVHQTRETTNAEDSAEKIAKVLLSEARAQRTKDNTSILFLDFNTNHT